MVEDDSNYLNEIKKLEEVIIQIKESQNLNSIQITDCTLMATASSANKDKVNKFLDDIFMRIDVRTIFKKLKKKKNFCRFVKFKVTLLLFCYFDAVLLEYNFL